MPAITDSKLGDTAGLSSAEVDAAAVRCWASGGAGSREAALTAASRGAQGASGAALWQVAFMPGADTRALAALEWGAPATHACACRFAESALMPAFSRAQAWLCTARGWTRWRRCVRTWC